MAHRRKTLVGGCLKEELERCDDSQGTQHRFPAGPAPASQITVPPAPLPLRHVPLQAGPQQLLQAEHV